MDFAFIFDMLGGKHVIGLSEKNNGEITEETRVKSWEEQQQVTICSKAGSPSDLSQYGGWYQHITTSKYGIPSAATNYSRVRIC
jgi:hypothetical protein